MTGGRFRVFSWLVSRRYAIDMCASQKRASPSLCWQNREPACLGSPTTQRQPFGPNGSSVAGRFASASATDMDGGGVVHFGARRFGAIDGGEVNADARTPRNSFRCIAPL